MSNLGHRLLVGLLLLFAVIAATPASAQATRTWVSGVGDDVNPCSRTAPCKTFAGAISKTAAGGQISVLDPGGFGAVTITKSISIIGNGVDASILAAGTNGIVINVAATDVVNISGIEIFGASKGPSPGLTGIKVVGAGQVNISNCHIHDFSTAGVAIPTPTIPTRVSISDSRIVDTNIGVSIVAPSLAGTVAMTRSTVANVTSGVKADGTNANAFVSDDVFSFATTAFEPVNSGKITSFGNNTVIGGLGTISGNRALH